MSRRILYSPGFGAGWTTWEHDEAVRALMLTYQPLIDALDKGEKVDCDWMISRDLFSENAKKRTAAEAKLHPAVQQLIADVRAMGKEPPYLGGLRDLRVKTVAGRVRINEYDGSETVEEEGDYEGWM